MSDSPCNWPVSYTGCGCDIPAKLPKPEQAVFEKMAAEMLWAWTGRRFGTCTETVRPCRAECAPKGSTYWGSSGSHGAGGGWLPALIGGQWFNLSCGACANRCTCSEDRSKVLRLPGTVATVTEVWIGGAKLDASAYHLRDGLLYRVDGGTWPWCNDDVADPTVEGSPAWQITYERGTPVPETGKVVAGLLACELMKAACQDKTCQLPQRVQSVTRQGVSVGALVDSFEDLKDGRTGIWLIDSWVAQMNAPKVSPPQVFSPDIPRGNQRGTRAGIVWGGR